MIIFASGRTDIPAFYSRWFMNRYKEGYVDVRNPFRHELVSRLYFSDCDLIQFCSKNPLPLIPHLKEITQPIVFHVTLTPYKEDIEPGVKDKSAIIEGIKEISKIIGKQFVYVRYDPIFLSKKYTLAYHQKAFERVCSLLDGYVEKIIVSFLDMYKNVEHNRKILDPLPFTEEDYKGIGESFSASARNHRMTVETCYEKRNLTEYGFEAGECLSLQTAYLLTGKTFPEFKGRKGEGCHCAETCDIGAYNSCMHLCKYCYANYAEDEVRKNLLAHDEHSSLILGHLQEGDIIKVRK